MNAKPTSFLLFVNGSIENAEVYFIIEQRKQKNTYFLFQGT